ncbi:Conserved carboxylase region [uncultured delta proteobacterium]|uniref:Conserved carboxylase region n=1 Tax=uncultured delta proteobacterium TaxID=34034 RepID=A0A212KHG6_9DELT|nr:Conserved carboxylase region [uncultured delta proteobacterium]
MAFSPIKPVYRAANASGQRPLNIMETVLRDGHQSLAATRMRLSDMEPELEALDEIGYWALEAWGGATFDSALRFLNEDPWERLRFLRSKLKKTPISMLLRGQNILGYNHYADDVVETFVEKMVEHGISVIRIFDALNDVRNLETAIKAAKKSGAHVQGACVYTISPYHTAQNYVDLAETFAERGVDSLAIKDMSGLLAPYDAYNLVKSLKENPKTKHLPVHVHTHYTSGMGSMTYLKAAEAGADCVDCALSPFALGTSQPATESIIAALEGQPRDTGIKKESLYPIADFFRDVKKKLAKDFSLNTAFDVDTKVLTFQLPGGMLSNLRNQLKEQGWEDKYPELLEEMPKVRADLGYPPLVTPTSQIVGSMAAMNVGLGERYMVVPQEVSDLARGKYGKTPAPVNPEVKAQIIGDLPIIDYRPADDIPPQMESLKKELGERGYPNASVEDVLSYALFPEVAIEFFKKNR